MSAGAKPEKRISVLPPDRRQCQTIFGPHRWYDAAMDLFNLAFYAVICGMLSVVAPLLGRTLVRLGVGMIVGVAAAGALPALKSALGV